jgi:hypothetical protein
MLAKTKGELPPADDAVRGEWLRRTQAEYRSSAITAQVSLWLLQLGAPPQLIRQGLRIVNDELRHAELSHRVYRSAGGTEIPPLAREGLGLRATNAGLERDLTRAITQIYCLGETAAVRLFHRLREPCTVPVARAALDRVLRDEVRHRDFGWTTLEWLLSLPQGQSLRDEIALNLPAMIQSLVRGYGGMEEEQQQERSRLTPETRAWGLMTRADYRGAIELCIKRDLRPRFAKLGIPLA